MTAQQLPPKTNNLYRRLLSYAFEYRGFFIVSIIGFALFAGMEAIMAMLVEFFLNNLEGRETDSLNFIPKSITTSLYFVPAALVLLAALRGVGAFLGNFYMGRVGLGVVNDLRKQIFGHMIFLPQRFYDEKNSGELVSLIIYNIEQVTGSVTRAVKILFQDGMQVIVFLIFLLYMNWQLTITFIAVTPILAALIYLASRYFRRVSRRIQLTVGRVTHIATESFQSIKLVKSYNGEKYENRRFKEATDENLRFGIKFERVSALQTPILHIVIASALATLFLLVLFFWEDTSAKAVVFVTLAGRIAKPFRQLSTINSVIQRGLAAAETIFETLDIPAAENRGSKTLVNTKGAIALNNISFHYQQDQLALKQLDLAIAPGETIALVGASGSGKSTIVNLLLRFYEPQQGKITIDGNDIRELSLSSLRDNIALVNQQTILFNDSVLANIAYGSDNIDRERVIEAAKNAYAEHFINELEHGFDTEVGEDGDRLSGGQRQRIAIARALYKDAPILILDEATSALDNESEKQIQKALENLKQGRTTLIIAHRLSTIENADKIVVLDRGEVVEAGTHQQLLQAKGYYAKLHSSQRE
ncbi:lipid A export permease/ATP-binding protein MsbA [Teredinibacter haidensis]|uniref:lipid A export permease/ATP-binding protein MsbA n=1 Tax=Teredinibacter haidensis TaxID=2731755 RepID=UPI000949161E|nr:lipid A export permease/ATP-binding protein MsbA [Teredinibacter haidensis]